MSETIHADTIEFQGFGKIPRLNRGMIVTEKIDGTNSAIGVTGDGQVYAQSRKRIITPDSDNFGFARWVHDYSEELAGLLGPGLHFGEWWGSKIQRTYGLTDGERRFSLFNAARWAGLAEMIGGIQIRRVPVLYEGVFDTEAVDLMVDDLRLHGSVAAPGFMDPEGVVVWHEAARQMFKVTCQNDEAPKSLVAA